MKSVSQFVFYQVHFLLFVFITCMSCSNGSDGAGSVNPDYAIAGDYVEPGWHWSYQAGHNDPNGIRAGGTEAMHLVGHKGRLFVGLSYWTEKDNIYYGGDPVNPWAQVIRLDSSNGQWFVDLDLDPEYLRVEALNSVTFTTDGNGDSIDPPETLLIAGSYSLNILGSKIAQASVFIRDDQTGQWFKKTIFSTPYSGKYQGYSIRALTLYRDTVTGIDRVFASIGTFGILSGVYDASRPGKIRWDLTPEIDSFSIRPLAIVPANGALHVSAGKYVFKRNDGPNPTYTMVHDMSDEFPGEVHSGVGGIRGLTAIPNPNGPGESLLYIFHDHIYRLDPDGQYGYTRHLETSLTDLMEDYLGEVDSVKYILGAYNDMLPVTNPHNQEIMHLIGFEAECTVPPYTQQKINTGFYPGATYAIRDESGNYSLGEVNGHWENGIKPILVAARTYTFSPFPGETEDMIFFGGYDPNGNDSHDTAWIFNATRETVLGID